MELMENKLRSWVIVQKLRTTWPKYFPTTLFCYKFRKFCTHRRNSLDGWRFRVDINCPLKNHQISNKTTPFKRGAEEERWKVIWNLKRSKNVITINNVFLYDSAPFERAFFAPFLILFDGRKSISKNVPVRLPPKSSRFRASLNLGNFSAALGETRSHFSKWIRAENMIKKKSPKQKRYLPTLFALECGVGGWGGS